MTTSNGKHIEEISHAHIVSSMIELIPSSRRSDDLSISFDRSRDRRQHELTNNKKIKRKYHMTITLKYSFGYAKHHEKALVGLGCNLTLTGKTENAVLHKKNAINNAKNKNIAIQLYVPQYTPSLEQQTIYSNQIVKKIPTEFQNVERSVFMKEVSTQYLRTFALRNQEGTNVPIWIIVGFQQGDRQHDKNLNNDTFYRSPVTSAQCIIGTEKYTDRAILLNSNDDDFCQ